MDAVQRAKRIYIEAGGIGLFVDALDDLLSCAMLLLDISTKM